MGPKHITEKEGYGDGVLRPHLGRDRVFSIRRFHPSADVDDVVEHYWTVAWDRTGHPPFTQETLPDPTAHVVFEVGRSECVGPMTTRFTRVLEGKGRVFAAKLRPACLRALLGVEPQDWRDVRRPVFDLLDVDGAGFEAHLFSLDVDDEGPRRMAQLLDDVLAFAKRRSPTAEEAAVRNVVEEALSTSSPWTRVDDIARRLGKSVRQTQRLFALHVGLSPKHVLQRRLVQKAAAALDDVEPLQSVADLAVDLGFADQAHLTRAFKKDVGDAPGAYRKKSERDRG